MAYLRFTRDQRGYENTYLVETVRRRGREHTRVLYWFRSPPQIKVGRAAIDEDAIRALEDALSRHHVRLGSDPRGSPTEAEPAADERRRPADGARAEREPRREVRPAPPPPATKAAAQPRIDAPEFQNRFVYAARDTGEAQSALRHAASRRGNPEMPAVQSRSHIAAVERPNRTPPALRSRRTRRTSRPRRACSGAKGCSDCARATPRSGRGLPLR